MCNDCLDEPFNESEFRDAVSDLVVPFQQSTVLSLIDKPASDANDIEAMAMQFLGESRASGIILPMRADGPSSSAGTGAPISTFIRRELLDLLCTNSARYRNERKEGISTVKNLITIVATAASAHYSLPLGVVTGAVTLLLMSALKVGRNAYCEANKEA
ncbi:hypothetical protein [Burkholderia cepacia]|uniref:hypothetical protein n=1 Tax=Burkholderia cepacia TaxID=292 RepID=UPI0012D9699F|nr:hypothetical protein [Burkholderia cepacia]